MRSGKPNVGNQVNFSSVIRRWVKEMLIVTVNNLDRFTDFVTNFSAFISFKFYASIMGK